MQGVGASVDFQPHYASGKKYLVRLGYCRRPNRSSMYGFNPKGKRLQQKQAKRPHCLTALSMEHPVTSFKIMTTFSGISRQLSQSTVTPPEQHPPPPTLNPPAHTSWLGSMI